MAITYYRELKGSELLDRVESWHTRYAWLQNFGHSREFFGAPSPGDIAERAYGRWDEGRKQLVVEERLKKSLVTNHSKRDMPASFEKPVLPPSIFLSPFTPHRQANTAMKPS